MGFFGDDRFPWTNFHEENLDWIITTLKMLEEKVKILENQESLANRYTDQQIAIALATMRGELAAVEKALRTEAENVVQNIQNQIAALSARIEAVQVSIAPFVDARIDQNNQKIYATMGEAIQNATVTDYFSGERVTVQKMFDILAAYHLEDPMTYNQFAGKNVTYSHLASLNITYIQLANNGNNLVR